MADRYRLPAAVQPVHYRLVLEPDLVAATFSGEVTIEVDALEETGEVVLNAIDLAIDEATVDGAPATATLDADQERVTLALAAPLQPGRHEVALRFRGTLNDKLRGFYRSTFTDSAGAEHTLATTQFEATDARRAFPCWDEPERKATFGVTLVVPEGLLAVSNERVVSDEPTGDGRRRVTFADTMKMSTYLVAFVVGPLVATDEVDVDGVPLRVVAPAERLPLADFALEVGAAALRTFTDFFGIPYPGGKLDLVAIPDFAFGAMENLGCVTFRETALLVDQATGSQVDLQRVADVVNHEIAHMWFGDLVTMKWWNGIWLNEAFATFMEIKATDALKPEWDRWTAFGVERAAAFATDSLAATRPIEFPVVSPAEAEGMFDVLTYQKGCAVMRMLEQYVGEDGFREGLRLYMRRHAHANTETGDLWDAIEEATGAPVRSTMDSWILQGGHPLVTVALSPDGTHVTIEQERFLVNADEAAAVGDARWSVPVVLRTSNGDVHRTLLTEAGTTVDLGAKAGWIVANAGGAGFYRVRYASGLLSSLLADLPAAALTPLERHALVADSWAACQAGLVAASDVVEVIRALAMDDDPDVWAAIAGALGGLRAAAQDEATEAKVAAFVRSVAGPRFAALGWDPAPGEDERTGRLRGTLAMLLGTTGDDDAVAARSRQLLDAYLDDRSAVPPDLVNAVVTTVARRADAATWELLVQRYRDAATPQEGIRFLQALGRARDAEVFQRTLGLYLSNEVRSQDGPLAFAIALGNPANGAAAWEVVSQRWDEVNARFPSNSISRLLSGLGAQSDPALAASARGFLSEHPLPQGAKQVAQILETMEVNVRVQEQVGPTLADVVGPG